MYNPLVGRFLEEDPIDFDAGDPNLYRYVGNSPTNGTDPSGLDRLYVKDGYAYVATVRFNNSRVAGHVVTVHPVPVDLALSL